MTGGTGKGQTLDGSNTRLKIIAENFAKYFDNKLCQRNHKL